MGKRTKNNKDIDFKSMQYLSPNIFSRPHIKPKENACKKCTSYHHEHLKNIIIIVTCLQDYQRYLK